VPEFLKVPKEQFEAVMRALLNTKPMPASERHEAGTEGREAAREEEARLNTTVLLSVEA
jgi:hypothetical protein